MPSSVPSKLKPDHHSSGLSLPSLDQSQAQSTHSAQVLDITKSRRKQAKRVTEMDKNSLKTLQALKSFIPEWDQKKR